MTLLVGFYLLFGSSQLFYWPWTRIRPQKTIPTLFAWQKNSRTMHRIWHKSFSMIQSTEIITWLGSLINKTILRLNLLFLSVTWFCHYCKKITRTQKVLHNWENTFLHGYFLTVLPKALFKTQPKKVYGGAFLQEYLTSFRFFFFFCCKKPLP